MRADVLVAAVLLAILLPSPASAHAGLVDSFPRQGERLESLPAEILFEFDETMSDPAYVAVTAPDGTSVTTGDPRVDGVRVRQSLTSGIDGSYTVAYRAVSEDGHAIIGELDFLVGPAGSAADGQSAADRGRGQPMRWPAVAAAGALLLIVGAVVRFARRPS
ncbi:MAG: copper resistance CopC family protein [Nocardioides sp.]